MHQATLLVPTLASLLQLAVAAASTATGEQNCPPQTCGNLTITYPFWLTGQPRGPYFCGYPALELTCMEGGHAYLKDTFKSHLYRVKDVFYMNGSFTIVDSNTFAAAAAAAAADTCYVPDYNASAILALFPARISSVNKELFFLYNCTPQLPLSPQFPAVTCTRNRTYAHLADEYSDENDAHGFPGNCTVSTVPVLGNAKAGARAQDYMRMMRNGFMLEWTDFGNCFACDHSGGQCVFDGHNAKFMCACSDGLHPANCFAGSKWRAKFGIGMAVAATCLIALSFLAILWHKHRKRRRRESLDRLVHKGSSMASCSKDLEFASSQFTHIFSYEELDEATDGFSNSRELGDGGFGTVYKGTLRDGHVVAVKRLYKNSYKGVEQFLNELHILSRVRHPNLVTLYGCTSSRSRDLLLVYEFVPNGTVEDHLHGVRAVNRAFAWPVRMRIAVETADALDYLHRFEPQIVHRDVKTNNILLDHDFHVRVADFGLSRLVPLDTTHVSTAPRGTPGYVDPMYQQCYQLTDKSDVYSFGVVLVELISSKPVVDIKRSGAEISLANMAVSKIQNHKIDQLVDPELGYQSDSETKRTVDLVAELAFRCLQPDRDSRPPMSEVLEVLRAIQKGEFGTEKIEKDASRKQDAVYLLKKSRECSPDTVMHTWTSLSTTSNASG